MAQLPPIKCNNFKPFTGTGSLKGFAEIEVTTAFGPLLFRDVKLVQQDGKDAFIAPPQKEYQNREGKKVYTALVEFPKEWRDHICNIVMAKKNGVDL
jgi:hypothetical protein